MKGSREGERRTGRREIERFIKTNRHEERGSDGDDTKKKNREKFNSKRMRRRLFFD